MSQSPNNSVVNVTILGATGSIGLSTLDVIAQHADRFNVFALTANTSVDSLYQQCLKFSPRYAVLVDESAADKLSQQLKQQCLTTEVLSGKEALSFVANHSDADYVMAAIVGAAGLLPTLAAVEAGKRVLLANKEALVMSGHLFMAAAKKSKAVVLPIDSEHNAIFQCLPQHAESGLTECGVRSILLTASGGPFRESSIEQLQQVTPAQACAHPNWDMGKKISVDSATLMNKGLELIEACWLFDVSPEDIQVVIHPQSVVHSLVDYIDGSVLAQMGNPDMRTPIAYGLAWPERMVSGVDSLNLFDIAKLEFERPDMERFPCLRLAQEAMKAGGTATTVLNAANEVAVSAFLDDQISFMDIPRIIEAVLTEADIHPVTELADILSADERARQLAMKPIKDLVVS